MGNRRVSSPIDILRFPSFSIGFMRVSIGPYGPIENYTFFTFYHWFFTFPIIPRLKFWMTKSKITLKYITVYMKRRFIILAIFTITIITSCASRKNLVYFQDEPLEAGVLVSEPEQLVYKPDDILTINVSALSSFSSDKSQGGSKDKSGS